MKNHLSQKHSVFKTTWKYYDSLTIRQRTTKLVTVTWSRNKVKLSLISALLKGAVTKYLEIVLENGSFIFL